MKRVLYIFTVFITSISIAQTSNLITLEKQKLKQALAYGDKIVAANSMFSIISLEGPQSTYKDSLAYLYFNARNYVSCYLVTNDILKSKPDNTALLEMQGVSLESMGALEKASETYNTLLKITANNYHAYKLAGIQFSMKKYELAYISIKKANELPDDGTLKVTFQINKNYNQNVNLKAAISYLEGLIAQSLDKSNEAKLCFEKAVKLFPEFILAKSKLETLAKKE